jgi:hypothetical protein
MSPELRAKALQQPSQDAAAIAPQGTEEIERVVLELNRICKSATFDFAMKVGRIVVDHFYAGKLEGWRHRGAKDVSFRKLAKHPDLPMSPSALYRSVAIYEVCTRLEIDSWRHVSTSHIRLVLGLPGPEQARLLREAEGEEWSVRRLQDEIAQLREEEKGIAPLANANADSALKKVTRALSTCLDESDHLVNAMDDGLALSRETARSIAAVVNRISEACSMLQVRLNKCLVDPQMDSQQLAGDEDVTENRHAV